MSVHEEEVRAWISANTATLPPDFAIVALFWFPAAGNGDTAAAAPPVAAAGTVSRAVSPEAAVPVVNRARPGAKMTKVTIITNQDKYTELQTSLDKIGITGMTVTNVLGYGMQKGHTEYYRGAPVKTRLLPKVQVDIVVCKIPTETVVDTVKKALYTGNMGDGKIFIYDVENVIKIRTGEEGYDAPQDEEDE